MELGTVRSNDAFDRALDEMTKQNLVKIEG
jgi:hypothetical protein